MGKQKGREEAPALTVQELAAVNSIPPPPLQARVTMQLPPLPGVATVPPGVATAPPQFFPSPSPYNPNPAYVKQENAY
ncbi:hypothetical protein NL676_009108 [Syzygium grande]|nr:hypothetical protein NL676_009108 [Syzygium grande]